MGRGFGKSTIWLVALVTVLVLGGLITLARNGLVDVVQLSRERDRVSVEKEAVDDSNRRLLSEIERLREDPEALEPYARRDLGLARPGELIYQLDGREPRAGE